MATTHAQRRRCLLFMALVFAVAVAAVAAARPPPSFSGTADGDDGNVLVAAAGSRGNQMRWQIGMDNEQTLSSYVSS
uniref:Purple acid phosphatase N-terminal domain-containing protein n=1 Tax=Oryza nivara TaxID=4536 RepID=A0A0E0HD80_ORYNI